MHFVDREWTCRSIDLVEDREMILFAHGTTSPESTSVRMALTTLLTQSFVVEPLLLLSFGHLVDGRASTYPVIFRITVEAVSKLWPFRLEVGCSSR